MKKKISIVNAHWNNRGDEAALLALIKKLQKKYVGSQILIIFKDDSPIAQFPKLGNVSYFIAKFNAKIWDIWLATFTRGLLGSNKLLKKTVKNLLDSDIIIYSPGGSVINDRFYWRKQMEYLVPFICAKLYSIPLFVAASSIGPFYNKSYIRKSLLKVPKVTCVREEISKEYLEKIGIQENVHVTFDLAFLNSIDKIKNEKKLNQYVELRNFLNSHNKVVGIVLTDFKWHVKFGKDKKLQIKIKNTFDKLIQKLISKGYGVLFIPQLFGNQNDYDYLTSYCCANTFVMKDTMDSYFQQFVISKLYAIISMRYHPIIFAAKAGTPFVAVAYEEKVDGFLNMAGLIDYSLTISDISFKNLYDKFTMLEQNHDIFKLELQKNVAGWIRKAKKTINLLNSIEF